MKYIEFSKEKLQNSLKNFFSDIKTTYKPDAILFVAKGGFYLGLEASIFFNIPLFEVKAERKANKLKSLISPFLKILPQRIKYFIRKIEIKSNIHKKIENRNIILENENIYNYKNILLIDDSVDTGSTIFSILKLFENKDINIKIAVLNVMTNLSDNFKPDYYMFENCIIISDWSSDSKNYNTFIRDYNEWKRNG